MIALFLLACSGEGEPVTETGAGTGFSPQSSATGDTGQTPVWGTDPHYVWVDPLAVVVEAGLEEWNFGAMLATSHDLDKDGLVEWSVGVPSGSRRAIVRVFEGIDVVTERPVPDSSLHNVFPSLLAGGDLDDDGFGDLLVAIDAGGDSRLMLVADADEVEDRYFALDVGEPIASSAARPIGLSVHGGLVAVGWRSATRTGVTSGALVADAAAGTLSEPNSIGPPVVEMSPVTDNGLTSRQVSYPTFVPGPGVPTMGFGVVHTSDQGNHGDLWECPTAPSGSFDECTLLATGDVGGVQATGDMNSDGDNELISTGLLPPDANGILRVFGSDGSVMATITGTKGAQLGLPLMVVKGPNDGVWLLVGQYNGRGTEPATVYAFRGTDVVGELTDEDAERVYVSEIGSRFEAFEVYRETPDADPILLLGHPAASAVYMVPFDPGSPMKAETP